MVLTNIHNIPKVLYDKIFEDINTSPYENPDELPSFRTTEMLGAPLPRTLFNQYKDNDKFVVDASHYLTLQFGKAFHKICEGDSSEDLMYELKVSRVIEIAGHKYLLNGMVDELEHNDELDCMILTDNKTCLISNLGYDKPEYYNQVNVYRYLLAGNMEYGTVAMKLKIRYFIKDLTGSYKVKTINRAAPNSPAYQKALKLPDCSIYYEDVPEFPEVHTSELIIRRITDHIDYPERICTFEERWDVNDSFAVMLAGNKRAKRILATAAAAENYIEKDLKPKDKIRASVVKRVPATWEKDKKCQYYCAVKSICPHAKEMGYIK